MNYQWRDPDLNIVALVVISTHVLSSLQVHDGFAVVESQGNNEFLLSVKYHDFSVCWNEFVPLKMPLCSTAEV